MKNKPFRKELATELLSNYSSQNTPGRQIQNAPARLTVSGHETIVCDPSRRPLGTVVCVV